MKVDYCREKVAQPGTIIYYCTQWLRPTEREATLVLLTFFKEIQDIPLECRDPQVAMAKLAWWYDELLQTIRGQPTHPVSIALHSLLQDIEIPLHELQIPFHQVQQLLTRSSMDSDELVAHFANYYYVYTLLTKYVYGFCSDSTLEFSRQAGKLLALADTVIHYPMWVAREYLSLYPGLACDVKNEGARILSSRIHDYQEQKEIAIAGLAPVDRYAQRMIVMQLELQNKLLNNLSCNEFNLEQAQLLPITACWHAWRIHAHERKHFAHLKEREEASGLA